MPTNPSLIRIHTDGGSRGNPGPSAASAVALRGKEIIDSASRYLGVTTNNVAEYEGLLLALQLAARLGLKKVEIRSDSELLVRQWEGKYRVKDARLKVLFLRARDLAKPFGQVQVKHVRREENTTADALVNTELDRAGGAGLGEE